MARRREIVPAEEDRKAQLVNDIKRLEAERNGLNQRINMLKHELELIKHPPSVRKPGRCPKCLRHIGRGVHIHEKNCSG